MFLTAYIKIRLNRFPTTVIMEDDTAYIGGLYDTREEASEAAREIVNSTARSSRAHILPRVFDIGDGKLIDGLYTATSFFESKVRDMNESAQMCATSAAASNH